MVIGSNSYSFACSKPTYGGILRRMAPAGIAFAWYSSQRQQLTLRWPYYSDWWPVLFVILLRREEGKNIIDLPLLKRKESMEGRNLLLLCGVQFILIIDLLLVLIPVCQCWPWLLLKEENSWPLIWIIPVLLLLFQFQLGGEPQLKRKRWPCSLVEEAFRLWKRRRTYRPETYMREEKRRERRERRKKEKEERTLYAMYLACDLWQRRHWP